MAAKQKFQEPDETEATLRRAVELYQRDRTQQEAVDAARGALGEMEIPVDYFEAAQKERQVAIEQKQEQKRRQRLALEQAVAPTTSSVPKTISEAIAQLIHGWGFLLVLGALPFIYSIFSSPFGHRQSSGDSGHSTEAAVPDGKPQTWDIASSRSDFLFDANPQTDADMVKLKDGDGAYESVQIRSFGKDPKVSNDSTSNAYYAKAYLNDQTVYFHGLHHLKFKARSKGISSLYVGFTDTDDAVNQYSPDLDLTSKWKEYDVDLDKLRWLDQNGNWPETGRPPAAGGLFFYMGDDTDKITESGHVDFKDVELTE